MEDDPEDKNEGSGSGGLNVEVLRSYLAFARTALKAHKLLMAGVVVSGLVLAVLAVRFVPRTYSVSTVLMTVDTEVLDGSRAGPRSWAGAEGLIMRHENLERLIRETGLLRKYASRRPPLLATKDRVVRALLGPMDDKVQTAVLVGTLETKVSVTTKDDTLTISVDWSDAATAAELAQAAKDGFLRIRHKTEISAFQDKMAILDAHAVKLREEIDGLASQIKASIQTKLAEKVASIKSGAPPDSAKLVALPRLGAPLAATTDDQLPLLREQLASQRQKLTTMEAERAGRVATERAKLDEMKLRLTPNHPQVIAQEERLGLASQVSSELALLRSEAADTESRVRQREAMSKSSATSGGYGGVARPATATSEPLPGDILNLLGREDTEPAMNAQMAGAVVRYAALRDEVRGAKIALDTAQAAFNQRYQIVIPVEVPTKPSKPNLLVIALACVFLSLLAALALPVALELRRGVLVERWQVDHFQLPVLAELHLPEHTER